MEQLLPKLSEEEYQVLKADIEARGVQVPVEVDENGVILDGFHRARACKELGKEPPAQMERRGMSEKEKTYHALSLNFKRRRISDDKRDEIIIKLAEQSWTPEEIGSAVGLGHSRIYEILKAQGYPLSTAGNVDNLPARPYQVTYPARKAIIERNQKEQDRVRKYPAIIPEGEGFFTANEVYMAGRKLEEPQHIETPPLPEGKYRCIVVDPPWPVGWLPRTVRPNQGTALPYPIMTIEEITSLKVEDLVSEDCHLFLWTVQKYLHESFHVLEGWGFQHDFTMVWIKPGGFQVYGHPQFNVEFILCGRKGQAQFLDTQDFFCAPRRGESRKPDEFYDLIKRVCPEPRIDMFARKEHPGFDAWGANLQDKGETSNGLET